MKYLNLMGGGIIAVVALLATLLLLPGCSVLEAVEPDPCIKHYTDCQDSGLGLVDDGQ